MSEERQRAATSWGWTGNADTGPRGVGALLRIDGATRGRLRRLSETQFQWIGLEGGAATMFDLPETSATRACALIEKSYGLRGPVKAQPLWALRGALRRRTQEIEWD